MSEKYVPEREFIPTAEGKHPVLLSSLGVDHPAGTSLRQGKDWSRYQACRHDTFTLVALESHRTGAPSVGYTNQENYIKINFWLSGRHTTLLTGYGQREHDRPEVFITCGPPEMLKVDVLNADTHIASVALCLLSDFFPRHMGLAPDELPEPLRAMALPAEKPHAFHSFSLTPDLLAAARAILAAPCAVRGDPKYAQAKAVELMCLLMNHMTGDATEPRADSKARRRESRLYEARGILAQHYAQDLSLEQIAREVGLNKLALTSGFRRLFGMSVYDCLQKERLEHAFELLQDPSHSVAQIAEAVGYGHSCNFSTAFRARFGCTPHEARTRRARRGRGVSKKSRSHRALSPALTGRRWSATRGSSSSAKTCTSTAMRRSWRIFPIASGVRRFPRPASPASPSARP